MSQIRLRKTNKTIKLVNRRENIRLKKEENSITLKRTGGVGPQGPDGIKGDKGDSINVIYGTSPTPPDASLYPDGTIYVMYIP